MRVRVYLIASVSAVFLAASAAVAGSSAATTNANTELATAAYRALRAGDAETAIAFYGRAIESRELAPEVLANALLNRALAYQQLGGHELAVTDYTAAMRIDAMSAKLRAMALYNRGLSFQKLEQISRASEDFTSALFLDPGLSQAYFSRGNLLRQTGQHLFALTDYEKAIQFKYPEPARVYYQEALAYEALGRPANARAALGQALAARSDFKPAKEMLARLEGAPASDHITTASIATAASQTGEASAVAPALTTEADGEAKLQPAATTGSRKLFTDRVPVEEELVVAAAPAQEEASAEPEAAEAPAADGAEKIVAIEPVPEESVASEPVADEASTAEPAPPVSGWIVQVASAASEDAAWSTWKKMQKRHKALAGQSPVVVRADLGAKGTFYRVRLTGYDSQQAAKSACAKLKSGGVTCYISKASS
jgi:tetratricopeptide (TPR) repeat protein